MSWLLYFCKSLPVRKCILTFLYHTHARARTRARTHSCTHASMYAHTDVVLIHLQYLLLFKGCSSKGDGVTSVILGSGGIGVTLTPELIEVTAEVVVGYIYWMLTVYTTVPTVMLPSTSITSCVFSNRSKIYHFIYSYCRFKDA